MKLNTHHLIACLLLMSLATLVGCKKTYHERTYYEETVSTESCHTQQTDSRKKDNGKSQRGTRTSQSAPVIVVE